jgi:DNA-binding NarL/FixJ family response regulator
MKHRIFIVDDHAITRMGYRYIIGEEMDMAICGEASSALEALEKIPDVQPDLVISDLTMEGMSGLELIKHLKAQQPALPVLVVSMHDESLYAERALRAGARGYIMKSEVDVVVVKAIRRILGGGLFVSDPMGSKILMLFAGRHLDAARSPVETFSDRELEVFEHIGRGLSTQQIADAMLISPKTVDTYRARIKEKLAVETYAELLQHAVRWAQEQGNV